MAAVAAMCANPANAGVCAGGVPKYSVGNLGGLINSYSNRGRTLMDGVDIDARTRFALGDWGKLSTGIAATIRKRDTHDGEDGSDIKGNTVGYYDSPRYRATVNADWSYRNFVSSVFVNYSGKTRWGVWPVGQGQHAGKLHRRLGLAAGRPVQGRAVVHHGEPGLQLEADQAPGRWG